MNKVVWKNIDLTCKIGWSGDGTCDMGFYLFW